MRQKLIMHILALALMIGNGTLVASTIASSLELTQERTRFELNPPLTLSLSLSLTLTLILL